MKRLVYLFFMLCGFTLSVTAKGFVQVADGQFRIDGKPYYFVGTNFWYGAILGSEGQGGDRARLCRELDALQALGINNLRIFIGPEAGSKNANSVLPVLQNDRGELNDTLLASFDYLLSEMGKRHLYAVVFLNNSWDWSGGYGYYLRRTGHGDSPSAKDNGYNDYVRYASQFASDQKAHELYYSFIQNILGRTNRYTGKPYIDDPTIMAWQLCNEPRPFGKDQKEAFANWIHQAAALIKKKDPNHLVSTGSEGLYGCEVDMDLCERIHADSLIDYLTLHIWPYNWQWAAKGRLWEDLPNVYLKTGDYIAAHDRLARRIGKPYVIEEFGYPRDNFLFIPGTETICRNAFYDYIFGKVTESAQRGQYLAGCNFWGWGGEANPVHETWQMGDPYVCDPPHEPQGWYSVFSCDTTTLAIIRQSIRNLTAPQP